MSGSEMDSLEAYLREIRRVPLLTAGDEVRLGQRLERGDAAARRQLIEGNLRLVVSLARARAGRGVPLLDLVQEGNVGLMRAVERWDWRRGHRFSTYAAWWINRALSDAVGTQGRTVRLPEHVLESAGLAFRTEQDLEQRLGRRPTDAEIGRRAGLPAEKVSALRVTIRRPLSLEAPLDEEGEATIAATVADDADAIEDVVATSARAERLHALLGNLAPRLRVILAARFGLDGEEPQPLEAVARRLGISRERVRQLQERALNDLQHAALA